MQSRSFKAALVGIPEEFFFKLGHLVLSLQLHEFGDRNADPRDYN